jgi:hypothetical protein
MRSKGTITVSEDIKFPHAVVINRNLLAMLMDALVENGTLTEETRDKIIDEALSIEAKENALNRNSGEDFVKEIFNKGDQLGLTASAPPAKPVCPKCGVEVKLDQKFCTNCGQKLS